MRGRRPSPEAGIRRGIREFLKTVGFAVWDMEQNRPTRQTAGFSDLVAIGHNRILFIEVKTPKGKLSITQEMFGAEIEQNGGTYLVWRSVLDAWDYLESQGIVSEARP
jgi:Holliday junction resolvase